MCCSTWRGPRPICRSGGVPWRASHGIGTARPRRESALIVVEQDGQTPTTELLSSYRARDLTNEEFAAGCAVVRGAIYTAAAKMQLHHVLRRAFDGWLEPLPERLVDPRVPLERSDNLASWSSLPLRGLSLWPVSGADMAPREAFVLEA
jgi:hypothetical protein